jgi:sporulation protein YlmC with PRC-barrel domain
MKQSLRPFLGAAILSALSLTTIPLSAADKADPPRPDPARPATTREVDLSREMQRERLGNVIKASEVIGKEVRNLQDEKIGKVDDLAVDIETGRIVEVLVSSGGLLGIGDKIVAVPPTAFNAEPTTATRTTTTINTTTPTTTTTTRAVAHPHLRLDMTKERIKGAPAFEVSKWDEGTQTNRIMETYRYFGREPYFARTTPNETDRSTILSARLERASKVIGSTVRNEAEEKVGKVDNLMLDLEAGRIVTVILSSGGFLGVGDELRAVPPGAFRARDKDNNLVVNASKDVVTTSPHFKATEWPNFGDATYSAGVYRAYRVEPYFSTDADNTKRNVRDRDDRNLTPLDQGTSAADVDMTRRIRKEILDEKNFSVNARNVKVITINGRVTLRGPVGTEEEKRTIGEIAQRLAPGASVDNQLEVKRSENR